MPLGRKPKFTPSSLPYKRLKGSEADATEDQDFNPADLIPVQANTVKKQTISDIFLNKPSISRLLFEKNSYPFKNTEWVQEKEALKIGKKRENC